MTMTKFQSIIIDLLFGEGHDYDELKTRIDKDLKTTDIAEYTVCTSQKDKSHTAV